LRKHHFFYQDELVLTARVRAGCEIEFFKNKTT